MRFDATILLAALLAARSASGYLTSRSSSSRTRCHRPSRLPSGHCDATANRLPMQSYSKPSFSLYTAGSSDSDTTNGATVDAGIDLEHLKSQLLEYLAKRKEVGADDLAAAEVGKVVGGTKGNAILEYISGSPNKASTVETAPDALDYDQLTKYGYSNLVTPMMKAGGRLAMYRLLEMEVPDTSKSLKRFVVEAPKLIIDREGKTDKARYSGLKLGQALDDDMQAEALANYQQKVARGEEVRQKLEEELYERPFADRRNVSPAMTPDWTAERLDEWGKQQGKAQAWAKRAKAGEFVKDPQETMDLDTSQRVFSILTGLMAALALGKSTPTFLLETTGLLTDESVVQSTLNGLQLPAIGLLAASLGSTIYCFLHSQPKNRNALVWAVKGALGGPFTIRSLRDAGTLLTRAEDDERKEKDAQ